VAIGFDKLLGSTYQVYK